MRMLAGADYNRVEFLCMVKHSAEIGEFAGPRMLRGGRLHRAGIHVAQGDDILRRHAIQVRPATAARRNHRDVQLLIQIPPAQDRRHRKRACRRQSGLMKLSAGKSRHGRAPYGGEGQDDLHRTERARAEQSLALPTIR